MTPIDAPLRRQDFRDWLATKNAEAVVGTGVNMQLCPYATFLLQSRPVDSVKVAANQIRLYAGGEKTVRQTPPWLIRFIHAVDDTVRGRANRSVTADEATTILVAQGAE